MNHRTVAAYFALWTRVVYVVAIVASVVVADAGRGCAASPNMLVILADDCTFSDLPLYGGKNARTPNIDRFAAQGLTFNRAYVSAAMCQPCRA